MDSTCYSQGSCKLCGCTTIALQCANKPCDAPCYPTMMSKSKWKYFKEGKGLFSDSNGLWELISPQPPYLTTSPELVLYNKSTGAKVFNHKVITPSPKSI